MQIFKKINKENMEKPSKKIKNKKIKKKTKIGFKHKNKEKKLNEKQNKNYKKNEKIDEIVTEIPSVKEEGNQKEKKNILKKDMKGQPVFLEDTGEKIGIIFDTITDEDKNILGYKIKDQKSDSVLSFSLENFEETKKGFVFIPGWYTNSLKIIEKLEFKDKISPELTALLTDDATSNEELYEIFVKHDDEMVKYIDDARSLIEMLTSRLKVLEKERLGLKDDLMDLTEKRLIKDIDRKQFSEEVMNHRRKVNILDININKCKNLIKRLEKTSFGMLNKNDLINKTKKGYNIENNLTKNITDQDINIDKIKNYKENKKDLYEEKYYILKQKYDELEDEYKELKIAVDELVSEEGYI